MARVGASIPKYQTLFVYNGLNRWVTNKDTYTAKDGLIMQGKAGTKKKSLRVMRHKNLQLKRDGLLLLRYNL